MEKRLQSNYCKLAIFPTFWGVGMLFSIVLPSDLILVPRKEWPLAFCGQHHRCSAGMGRVWAQLVSPVHGSCCISRLKDVSNMSPLNQSQSFPESNLQFISDSQLVSVLYAMVGAIRNYGWRIETYTAHKTPHWFGIYQPWIVLWLSDVRCCECDRHVRFVVFWRNIPQW